MCGRYGLLDDLPRRFGFAERLNLAPSYSIAPTQAAPVVRQRADGHGRNLTPCVRAWCRYGRLTGNGPGSNLGRVARGFPRDLGLRTGGGARRVFGAIGPPREATTSDDRRCCQPDGEAQR